MLYPSREEFLKLTQKGNLIPVYSEILGDLDTPVSVFFKIAAAAPYSFLLESVEGEEKVARYSFVARDPEMILRTKDDQVEISIFSEGKERKQTKPVIGTPMAEIREILAKYKFVHIPGLPRFCGGLVGYIGYDMVRFFEELPDKPEDDLGLPDMVLMLAGTLVIFDHRNHKVKLVSCAYVPEGASRKAKLDIYRRAERCIEGLIADLRRPLAPQPPVGKAVRAELKVRSNFTPQAFQRAVREAKKDIASGEIIQVVLSQRFTVGLKTEPFQIYRSLRTLNPSPYMYYLNFRDMQIVGSSPELLVRCEDGTVETRPIAGTRPRGKDDREDAELIEDLLNDPKEKAEHIMLVDLGRNDLGRVCQRGTVQVSEFMSVEKYSHVMHIVSNVRGKLNKGLDALDVLQAAFPAGTLSGAPKIRAMQIIDRLEPVARGPYGGCIGYFSFSGNLDSCITIRTIVVKNGQAYIQAGAGIVADSHPQKEYQETVNKARAQILAIEAAHRREA